jgi:glucose-1-phosphate thymidylyltransferase
VLEKLIRIAPFQSTILQFSMDRYIIGITHIYTYFLLRNFFIASFAPYVLFRVKGLILAGGHGTRLRPLTFRGNKHMLPIGNKPMLVHALDHLANAGIKDIAIVLGPIKEGIRESIGDGTTFGVKVTYLEQPEPLGLAHAVIVAEDFVKNDPFIMYLGDNLIKQGVKPLIYDYYNNRSDCVICVSKVKNPSQFGVVELDDNGQIVALVEKPKTPKTDLALAGVYLFNSSIVDAVKKIKPSWRNELEITDAIQHLLLQGKKISIQRIEGWWKDTGKPNDLLEANQLVLDDIEENIEGRINATSEITGKVSIGKNTVVNSESRIRGPVIIGENCEIGPKVYIGPYTSIGNNSKILSCEIDSSIVMQGVYINCKKRIVDSIIGNGSIVDSGENVLPSGIRFVLGESTHCTL